jgi:membrane protease YdiL (CAAX protease family)
MSEPTPSPEARGRALPVWGFLLLVVVYLVLVQAAPRLFELAGSEYGTFKTTEDVLRSLLPAVVTGSVIALAAVAFLRWWRPVMSEDERTPRWTWVFPIVLVLTSLAAINYSGLADEGAGFTLVLLVCALLVGVSEETMFRGIGVVTFRRAGLSEGWVAIWTSVVFGCAHATNILDLGPRAIVQVLVTAFAGYFFYMTRRASGGLVVPILAHGLWDFGSFTNALDDVSLRVGLFIVADVILAIIALATIRKVFRRNASTAPPAEVQT